MPEDAYGWGVLAMLVAAAVTLPVLLFVVAPYGRHAREGFGPGVPARWGWLLMEAPAPLVFAAVFAGGDHAGEALPLFFLGLWHLHYLQRAFVFPFLMRGADKPNPLVPVVLAFVFNCVNGTLNAWAVSEVVRYGPGWWTDPRFLLGSALFLAGLAVNWQSDALLRRLRRPGETGYRIPHGGLFRWVSCPNYLGEIVEWAGWALATWSAAGLAFALFTFANLAPRAHAHHRWYRERFPDYPAQRRAVLPGLW